MSSSATHERSEFTEFNKPISALVNGTTCADHWLFLLPCVLRPTDVHDVDGCLEVGELADVLPAAERENLSAITLACRAPVDTRGRRVL
jgi:hypothetical protein